MWQVAWAHPKYGHILASCSYDGKVLIWKEQQGQGSAAVGGWIKIKEHTLHTASGTLISTTMVWEPHITRQSILFHGHLTNLVPSWLARLQMEKSRF